MFKHLLIPTDGSELSKKAVHAAIAFAKETGARLTGYYAFERPTERVYGDGYGFPDAGSVESREQHAREEGERFLAGIRKEAASSGIPFDSVIDETGVPSQGIVNAAKQHDCDAIFMASHGRKGLARLAIGSVTNEVIARSTIPVLVYR